MSQNKTQCLYSTPLPETREHKIGGLYNISEESPITIYIKKTGARFFLSQYFKHT